MIKTYIGRYVKYLLFFSHFNRTWFLDRFVKNVQISNFVKTSPVGAELPNSDGRTDGHDEANSHFSQFFESAESGKGCEAID
jgi:hypothetical protein